MASSQSFSMIQRRMLLSPWPASPVKSELPLWTSAIRLPSGVPCFIFNRRYAVAGAQEPEAFFPLFDLEPEEMAGAAD